MKKIILATCLMGMCFESNAMSALPRMMNILSKILMDTYTSQPKLTLCKENERYAVRMIDENRGSVSAAKLNLQNYGKDKYVFLTCVHGISEVMYSCRDDRSMFLVGDQAMKLHSDNVSFSGPLSDEYERAAEEYRSHVSKSVNNHDGIVHDYYQYRHRIDIDADIRASNLQPWTASRTFITWRVPDLYLPFDIALAFGGKNQYDNIDLFINSSNLPALEDFDQNSPINVEVHGFPGFSRGQECKFNIQCEWVDNGMWLKSTNYVLQSFRNKLPGMSGGPCFVEKYVNGKKQKVLCGILSGEKGGYLSIKTIPNQLINFVNSLR